LAIALINEIGLVAVKFPCAAVEPTSATQMIAAAATYPMLRLFKSVQFYLDSLFPQ